MNPSAIRKSVLAASISLSFGVPCAEAGLINDVLGAYTWSTDSANLTLLHSNGGVIGGTNNISIQWDGDAYNSNSDYTGMGSTSNVTLSSTAPFFGHSWAMHDIQVFMPGSYSFDTALDGGNPESGMMNATVNAGQLGMHMLWDVSGDLNVDVFVVFDQSSIFGSGIVLSADSKCSFNYTGTITKNCLYDGGAYGSAGAPVANQVWTLASADGNGDGVMGIPMASGGPFAGYSANFNANLTPTAIPMPAAVWLFGSGLVGLVSVARRRKGD